MCGRGEGAEDSQGEGTAWVRVLVSGHNHGRRLGGSNCNKRRGIHVGRCNLWSYWRSSIGMCMVVTAGENGRDPRIRAAMSWGLAHAMMEANEVTF